MNRREFLEGLLLLLFGGWKEPVKPAPPKAAVRRIPAVPGVRAAMVDYRAREWQEPLFARPFAAYRVESP